MITCQHRVGNLVEVRLAAPITAAELDAFTRTRAELQRPVGSELVVCTDLRGMDVLPPERSALFVEILRGSPALTRAAWLAGLDKAVAALQIERILREAGRPARRMFRDPQRLCAWLDEVLDEEERARLRVLVGAG